ncbi:MAG: ATP-binding protein, partial [Dissulfurispiraceae bacterium]
FQLRNIFVAAEIEAGEASPCISNVDAYKLIRAVIDSFRHVANQKQVTIGFDWAGMTAPIDPPLPFFKTDPEKLRIIVSNLVSNSVKYSTEGGKVLIKAWKHEGRLNIIAEDSGIGIDEADQQVIFERFRQLQTGTTKSYLGQGLGLSVTKALVELLNGTISVASIKGKGSIFTVLLPESKTEAEVDVFSDEGNEFIFEDGEKF